MRDIFQGKYNFKGAGHDMAHSATNYKNFMAMCGFRRMFMLGCRIVLVVRMTFVMAMSMGDFHLYGLLTRRSGGRENPNQVKRYEQ